MFMTLNLLTLMYYLKVKFKTVIWKPVLSFLYGPLRNIRKGDMLFFSSKNHTHFFFLYCFNSSFSGSRTDGRCAKEQLLLQYTYQCHRRWGSNAEFGVCRRSHYRGTGWRRARGGRRQRSGGRECLFKALSIAALYCCQFCFRHFASGLPPPIAH